MYNGVLLLDTWKLNIFLWNFGGNLKHQREGFIMHCSEKICRNFVSPNRVCRVLQNGRKSYPFPPSMWCLASTLSVCCSRYMSSKLVSLSPIDLFPKNFCTVVWLVDSSKGRRRLYLVVCVLRFSRILSRSLSLSRVRLGRPSNKLCSY